MHNKIIEWREKKMAEFKKRFKQTSIDFNYDGDLNQVFEWQLSQLPSLLELLDGEVGSDEAKVNEYGDEFLDGINTGKNDERERVRILLAEVKEILK